MMNALLHQVMCLSAIGINGQTLEPIAWSEDRGNKRDEPMGVRIYALYAFHCWLNYV